MILAIFVRGIVELIVFVLLDGDLVHHDYDEGGAENELAFIFGQLGTPVIAPDPARLHQAQNYVARVIVAVVTLRDLHVLLALQRDGRRQPPLHDELGRGRTHWPRQFSRGLR